MSETETQRIPEHKEIYPLVELSGTPREIGRAHGEQLRDEIKTTIELYRTLFDVDEEYILDRAEYFAGRTEKHFPQYAEEIDAIAEASKTNPLWIHALNARTEFIQELFVRPEKLEKEKEAAGEAECTTVYFPSSSLLAQNWDWTQLTEETGVTMRITRPDGHSMVFLTEPGIIGKPGMNSRGVGITALTLMFNTSKITRGVPVHILMRAILDSSSLEEAVQILKQHNGYRYTSLLVADGSGQYKNVECMEDRIYIRDHGKEPYVHTNFYTDEPFPNHKQQKQEAMGRIDKAYEIIPKLPDESVESMKRILLDTSREKNNLCVAYHPHYLLSVHGTISTIIMDLENKIFHYSKGSPLENEFASIKL